MSMPPRCKNNNLPVTRSVQTGHIPHWEGTSKGLINICVESGLVPLQKLLVRHQYYSKKGKKVNGEVDESTSLVFILGEYADFKNEVSVLQKLLRNTMLLYGLLQNITVK